MGMAIVDAVVTALLNIARVIEGKVLVGVQPFGRTFFKPVVATAVAGILQLVWRLTFGYSASMALTGLVAGIA